MQHPVIASANAKVRYDQLVQEANHYRQVKSLRHSYTGLISRILAAITGMFTPMDAKAIQNRKGHTTV